MESFFMPRTHKDETIVVFVLRARANFGKLLRQVEDEHRSFVTVNGISLPY